MPRGWPKGVPRKAVFVPPLEKPVEPLSVPLMQAAIKNDIRYDCIFSIRVHRQGPFKGLWELCKLDNEGKREVLTDANSRGQVIHMMNAKILKIVVAI